MSKNENRSEFGKKMKEKMLQPISVCLLLLICLILLLNWGECKSGKSSNKFSSLQGIDAIQVTRCDIVCFYRKDKKECQKECIRKPFKKHGYCPDSFDDLPVFVQACVCFCSKDSDCPSTEKCCTHSCGQTCKPASGLLQEKYLPSIPVSLTAKEKKKKNIVHLFWKMPQLDKDQLILYVLEERHHLGRFYNERLLGEWNPMHSCKKTSINLKNLIKPGYWYQFRVASVSINGTKGFSVESEGFKLTRRPKLQKPSKLRVEDVREKNGTIWGLVRWNPSESPIPVQKYKIFWSQRLDVKDLSFKSETVLVQRDTVPENQLFYQLKNLQKDTDYFIQVQSVAAYGRNSIKSKMAKMLFKTSKLEDQFEMVDFD